MKVTHDPCQERGCSATVRVARLPQWDAIRSARLRSGSIQDVEQFGAGSRAERVQALPKPTLELIGPHGSEATPRQRPP